MAWYDDLKAVRQQTADNIRNATIKANNYYADTAIAAQNTTSDRAQVDNYAAYMNAARNGAQQIASIGGNGGGSETYFHNMYNSYGGNRFATEAERGRNNSATNVERMKENNAAQIAWQQAYGDAEAEWTKSYAEDMARQEALNAAAAQAARSSKGKTGKTSDGTENIKDIDKYEDALSYARRLQNTAASSADSYVQSSQWFVNQMMNKGYSNELIAHIMNQINAR